MACVGRVAVGSVVLTLAVAKKKIASYPEGDDILGIGEHAARIFVKSELDS